MSTANHKDTFQNRAGELNLWTFGRNHATKLVRTILILSLLTILEDPCIFIFKMSLIGVCCQKKALFQFTSYDLYLASEYPHYLDSTICKLDWIPQILSFLFKTKCHLFSFLLLFFLSYFSVIQPIFLEMHVFSPSVLFFSESYHTC